MTGRPEIERDVTDWLHAEAVVVGAPAVLAGALDRVADLEQDRGRQIRVGRRRQPAVLTFAAIVGTLAIAVVGVVRVGPTPEVAGAAIKGTWDTGSDVAFVIELPPGAPEGVRWRAAMFDVWTGSATAWRASAPDTARVAAGAPILVADDEPLAGDVVELTATVRPVGGGPDVISPGMPTSIDQPVDAVRTGPDGALVRVSPSRPGEPYTITGRTLARASEAWPVGPSDEDLAAAGTDDPPGIDAQYAERPAPGELGAGARALLDDIRASAGGNRFRTAALLEARFLSGEFTYDVDTRDIDCGGRSFTECFLQARRGYCLYFATAMALLLREEGIPSRMVMGYLPGERVGTTETIRRRNAHAWVEVYFPGWGWVPFDPTPGGTRAVPRATGSG